MTSAPLGVWTEVSLFLDNKSACRLRLALAGSEARGVASLPCWCRVDEQQCLAHHAYVVCFALPRSSHAFCPRTLETTTAVLATLVQREVALPLVSCLRLTDGQGEPFLRAWLLSGRAVLTVPLPESLTDVSFGPAHFEINTALLPEGLKRLTLGANHCKPLGRLPSGLRELHLNRRYRHALPPLPAELRLLSISRQSSVPKSPAFEVAWL